MYRVAVVGDYESIYGFAALGADTVFVDAGDPAACTEALSRLLLGDYAVVYVTEAVAHAAAPNVREAEKALTPAVILIPGVRGNTGEGAAAVRRSVERAVGSDIL